MKNARTSCAVRWLFVVLCFVLVLTMGLAPAFLAHIQTAFVDPKLPSRVSAAANQDRVVGLPGVDAVAIQHINMLGLGDSTQTVIEFASPDGTQLESFPDSLAPEAIYIYPDRQDPTDLARIEYGDTPSGGNQIYGVNFTLSESGNAAYLGLTWEDASVSQSLEPVPFFAVYVPYLVRNFEGWVSAFVLQNRYQYAAANVNLTFFDQSGAIVCSYPETVTIPANGSKSFPLVSVDCLSDGFMGSAFIASDEPVAVARVINSNSQLGLLGDYRGVDYSEAATVLVAPTLFKAKDMQTSTLCVQNTGSSPTNVIVEYSDGLTRTATIASYATQCLDQGSEAHAAGWAGGAIIYSIMEPLVGVVNVTAYNGSTPVGNWMYTTLSGSSSGIDHAVALPVLFKDYEDLTSEVYLYNMADLPAVVTPRYVAYPSGAVYCAEQVTIPADSVVSLSQADLPVAFGRSMAYLSTDQPVAAVVDVTSDNPLGETDRHLGYRAAYPQGNIVFPDTCGTFDDREVFLPVVLK